LYTEILERQLESCGDQLLPLYGPWRLTWRHARAFTWSRIWNRNGM